MIAGIGIGVELVTIDVYIAELVSKHLRGRAFAFNQVVQFSVVPLRSVRGVGARAASSFGTRRLALGRADRSGGRAVRVDHPARRPGESALADFARETRGRGTRRRRDGSANRSGVRETFTRAPSRCQSTKRVVVLSMFCARRTWEAHG